MKYIVSYVHYDKFANEVSNIDKVRFDSLEEALATLHNFYPNLTTIDDMLLKRDGEIRIDAWNTIRLKVNEKIH